MLVRYANIKDGVCWTVESMGEPQREDDEDENESNDEIIEGQPHQYLATSWCLTGHCGLFPLQN